MPVPPRGPSLVLRRLRVPVPRKVQEHEQIEHARQTRRLLRRCVFPLRAAQPRATERSGNRRVRAPQAGGYEGAEGRGQGGVRVNNDAS